MTAALFHPIFLLRRSPQLFLNRTVRMLTFVSLALAAIAINPLLAQQTTSSPTITFTLDFPQSNPAHYSIVVEADGHARYDCIGKIADDSEEQTYSAEFEVSPANRTKIFDWSKQAKYFAGNIDSGNAKLAFTGAKQLSYRNAQRSNTAKYNYSNQEPVRELTTLFQNMATTLEYGHRLAYFHRYQKLALDQELKQMEALARTSDLVEIQSVAPVLQEIVDDNSVINVVRARAKQLIELANSNSAGR